MQNHRQWLRSLCGNNDVGSFDRIVAIAHARRQLIADELAKHYTLPFAAAQKGVGVRQRINAAVEYTNELVRRPTTLARSLRNQLAMIPFVARSAVIESKQMK